MLSRTFNNNLALNILKIIVNHLLYFVNMHVLKLDSRIILSELGKVRLYLALVLLLSVVY